MTVKKRLAISNVLMIVVPIAITLLIAAGCMGIIWYQIAHGTGLGFEDSEDFYQASTGISGMAADALKSSKDSERKESLNALSSFLDRGSMSLVVTADGEEYYRYGNGVPDGESARLQAAALALGSEGTVSTDKAYLRVRFVSSNGAEYVIFLYSAQSELSYTSLKVAVAIAGSVLILAILLAVFFTDRFLTRFIFRHIAEPLELLSDGVREISSGNLDYRLSYTSKDEFLPICEDFNGMAERLRESVERSRREEESRKELMAGISHDLRSPLTSIQAYVEGLLDGVAKTPETQRKYLMTVKAKAEELEGMVARILAYSRLELDASSREAALIPLNEYLAAQLGELKPDYTARGLDITTELAPFTILADASELRQLLVNIADNSLKYKIKERALLRVELTDEGDRCTLSFTDDGIGVSPEVLPKLFDVFYRADPARTDRAKGSGLGLAIVEKTVRRMGGTVRAENAEGGGLAIIIELPKGGNADAEDTDC